MEGWKLQPAGDLGLPLGERFRSLRREAGLIETAFHVLWWALIRAYLRACHRLRIVGGEHLPDRPPFILVANHASHLDALALAAPLSWRMRDRVFPLAAGDAFFERAPAAAFAALFLNALPLWRKNFDPRDIRELRRRLVEEPCGFILFPEGTRTRTGEMGVFRRGVGMLAAGTRVPVVPCHLGGPFESFPPGRLFPRFRRVTLTVGRPVTFEGVEEGKEGWTRVASELESRVRGLAGR